MSGIVPITVVNRRKQLIVTNIRDVKRAVELFLKSRPRDNAELTILLEQAEQAIGGYVSPRSVFNAFAEYAHRCRLVVQNKSKAWTEFEQTVRSAKTRDDIKAALIGNGDGGRMR